LFGARGARLIVGDNVADRAAIMALAERFDAVKILAARCDEETAFRFAARWSTSAAV
jgi:hypothetical protein